MVENINSIVENGIHGNIALVEKSMLFDVDLAYKRRWDMAGFMQEFVKDIKEKQVKLSLVLKNVENSIQVSWKQSIRASFTCKSRYGIYEKGVYIFG